MVRRKNYLGLVCGAVAALAMSCGGGGNPTPDTGTGTDAATDMVVTPTAHSYTYVINQLAIDSGDSPDDPHTGFNLDNLFSGPTDSNGCNNQDFFSMTDQDQNCGTLGTNGMCATTPNTGCHGAAGSTTCFGGVDNRLPTLANTIMTVASMDIRTTLADEINQSKIALVVRVTGITDPSDMEQASGITVGIYLAYPTFTTGCTSVAANQAYSVSRSSLTTGGTIDNPRFSFAASLHAGRLIVASLPTSTFDLPLPPIRGATLTLQMHSIQIRLDLSSTGLTRGGLGGFVLGGDIVHAVGMLAPDFCSVVSGAIGGLVDIQQNGICDDSSGGTHLFGGISLGLGVTALPATIDTAHPIADSQAPGTCGYTAPSDAGTTTDAGPTDGGY